MSWEQLLDKVLTKDELRDQLPIENVLYEEYGVLLNGEGRGLCPFHDEANPSFGIFESGDGIRRAGCWSCNWRGDLFDVIMAARSCGFNAAVSVAREMFMRLGAVRRTPVTMFKPRVAREVLNDALYASWERNMDPIRRFVQAKGFPFSAEWLREQFYVGVESDVGIGSILIPHLDITGQVAGYKVRTPYTPTIAARGSDLSNLYGVWRLSAENLEQTVVICEGETDTWFTQWTMPEWRAVGLPSGAGSPLRAAWLTLLAERPVIICFDNDPAGNEATRRWSAALPNARVVELEEGMDCVNTGAGLRNTLLA